MMSLDNSPLPEGASHQHGREDEVDKFVGDEDDAEGYHYESHDDERTIYFECALYMVAIEA